MSTDAEVIAAELAETCEHGTLVRITDCERCEDLLPGESLAPCTNCGGRYTCERKRTRCCGDCKHRLVTR